MMLTRTIRTPFLRPVLLTALFVITLTSLGRSSVQAADAAGSFLAALRAKVATSERENRSVLAGKDGWLFFVPELRSLSVGPFWGERAKQVSRSSKPDYADPLPAIVDFNDQLKRAGIELLVVPVPAKAAVYPDRLAADVRVDAADKLRFDPQQKEFYDLLGQRGVKVVDLLPLFTKHRDDRSAMYCRTDTHWSGAAVALAADRIVDRVRDQAWFKELSRTKYETEARKLEIAGDWRGCSMNRSRPAKSCRSPSSAFARAARLCRCSQNATARCC